MQCRTCEYEAPAGEFERYDQPTGAILRACPCCGGRRLRWRRWAVCYGGGPPERIKDAWVRLGTGRRAAAAFTVEHYPSAAAALRGIDHKAQYGYQVLGVLSPDFGRV